MTNKHQKLFNDIVKEFSYLFDNNPKETNDLKNYIGKIKNPESIKDIDDFIWKHTAPLNDIIDDFVENSKIDFTEIPMKWFGDKTSISQTQLKELEKFKELIMKHFKNSKRFFIDLLDSWTPVVDMWGYFPETGIEMYFSPKYIVDAEYNNKKSYIPHLLYQYLDDYKNVSPDLSKEIESFFNNYLERIDNGRWTIFKKEIDKSPEKYYKEIKKDYEKINSLIMMSLENSLKM